MQKISENAHFSTFISRELNLVGFLQTVAFKIQHDILVWKSLFFFGLFQIYLYSKDTKRVTFNDFINKELVLFSNADNERSIPSAVDGMSCYYSSTYLLWAEEFGPIHRNQRGVLTSLQICKGAKL